MNMQIVIPVALALSGIARNAWAQGDCPCDRTAIDWVLPGDFPKALARAKSEQRIVVIKGISFGVDTEGAKCATKGVW